MNELFTVKVSFSNVGQNKLWHQLYILLVDPRKMTIIKDFKHRISFLFSLKNPIQFLYEGAAIHDLEDILILSQLKTIQVKSDEFRCDGDDCLKVKDLSYKSTLPKDSDGTKSNEIVMECVSPEIKGTVKPVKDKNFEENCRLELNTNDISSVWKLTEKNNVDNNYSLEIEGYSQTNGNTTGSSLTSNQSSLSLPQSSEQVYLKDEKIDTDFTVSKIQDIFSSTPSVTSGMSRKIASRNEKGLNGQQKACSSTLEKAITNDNVSEKSKLASSGGQSKAETKKKKKKKEKNLSPSTSSNDLKPKISKVSASPLASNVSLKVNTSGKKSKKSPNSHRWSHWSNKKKKVKSDSTLSKETKDNSGKKIMSNNNNNDIKKSKNLNKPFSLGDVLSFLRKVNNLGTENDKMLNVTETGSIVSQSNFVASEPGTKPSINSNEIEGNIPNTVGRRKRNRVRKHKSKNNQQHRSSMMHIMDEMNHCPFVAESELNESPETLKPKHIRFDSDEEIYDGDDLGGITNYQNSLLLPADSENKLMELQNEVKPNLTIDELKDMIEEKKMSFNMESIDKNMTEKKNFNSPGSQGNEDDIGDAGCNISQENITEEKIKNDNEKNDTQNAWNILHMLGNLHKQNSSPLVFQRFS